MPFEPAGTVHSGRTDDGLPGGAGGGAVVVVDPGGGADEGGDEVGGVVAPGAVVVVVVGDEVGGSMVVGGGAAVVDVVSGRVGMGEGEVVDVSPGRTCPGAIMRDELMRAVSDDRDMAVPPGVPPMTLYWVPSK